MERQLWNALPNFLRTIDDALAKIGAEPLPPNVVPFVIGSWIGGDRDGNPFVTAEVTRDVILLGRWRAADLYYREVDHLLFDLSVTKASPELVERVAGISVDQLWSKDRIHWDFPRGNVPSDEPYRRLLAQLRERLLATRDFCEELLLQSQANLSSDGGVHHAYQHPSPFAAAHVAKDGHLIIHTTQELLDPLLLCYRSLEACGDSLIARG